jgi:hypothetical protein
MEKQPDQKATAKGLLQWATTPPQSYLVYVLLVILVGGISFLAGSMRPKKAPGFAPPPISAPRN